jgi:hypothetical protein
MTTADQHHLDDFFSGTINEKMQTMEKLYDQYKTELLDDERINHSLLLLNHYAAELCTQMNIMKLGSLCSNCAGQPGGGCCSSYMEANSDVILLLMNRLHGTTVNRQHSNMEECCFLSNSGCILPIKPI